MIVISMMIRACALIAKKEKIRLARCATNASKVLYLKTDIVRLANSIAALTVPRTLINAMSAKRDRYSI